MNQADLSLAAALRHALHAHPELSGQETWTKARLMDFLKEHTHLAELGQPHVTMQSHQVYEDLAAHQNLSYLLSMHA